MKMRLWLLASGLMALSLVAAACGPATPSTTPPPASTTTPPPASPGPAAPVSPAPPTAEQPQQEPVKPAAQMPKHGGTINLPATADPQYIDTIFHTVGSITIDLVNQDPFEGDWTKGNAGGYGTNEADWTGNPDVWKNRRGVLAESVTWTTDAARNEGTIVYKVRSGVHWALNPASEASRLVGGREMTADDLLFHLKRVTTDPTAYIYKSNPELRTANISQTGPWEVTVKVTLDAMISAIGRFGDSIQLVPPEVVNKYGGQGNWRNSVGTGPFMLTDYVPGSSVTLDRNRNYWEKDPIGPGKGNQLPYLDRTMFFIIPDASTRLAAVRTGKIDTLGSVSMEDAKQLRRQVHALQEVTTSGTGTPTINMRTDKPPFNDIRVRQAMHYAIDFKAISNALFEGQGTYPGRPFPYDKNYAGLYLGLDDPSMPAEVKDLWNYNPDKAKQLLKDAGYPNGFKTSALVTSSEVDSWAIYKDMLAKVGIDVVFDIREAGVYNNTVNNKQHEALVSSSGNPLGVWYSMPAYSGTSTTNRSIVNDRTIDDTMTQIRTAFITDGETKAFQMMKDLTKYIYAQVYEISGVGGPSYRFWWPWLKNYSGEANVGYFEQTFPTWVWIDQDLKKSMGY